MSEQVVIIAVEGLSSSPTKRFVRNKDVPLENEIVRERIVSARVMNGLNAVEASARLGYANSTQISQIESGQRKVPNDWQFLLNMSRVYSVSVDYLLGVSPNPERDAIASESFALLRGFEEIQQMQAAAMTTAFVKFGTERQASHLDIQNVCDEIDAVADAFHKMREQSPEFDDLRGGATVLAAVRRLEEIAVPLREKLRRRLAHEQHMLASARGERGQDPSYLTDQEASFKMDEV